MLFDTIALAVLAIFVVFGSLRGALASGLSLAAIGLSYCAAILCATRFGALAAEQFGIPPLAGPAAAGTIAFIGTYLGVAVVGAVLKSAERSRRAGEPRGAGDRVLGGFFGALRGGVIVLLLSWLGLWLDAARDLGSEGTAAAPSAQGSRFAAMTQRVVESAVTTAMGDDGAGARVAARFASRPGAALRSAQSMIDDPRIQKMQQDAYFWTLVENGATDSALNRASFYKIVHDPELRRQMADLGLIDDSAAENPDAFRDAVREVLDEVGPKLKGLKNDPELRALADDPEVVAALESGNTFALLSDPRIQRIAERVAAGD